MAVVADEPMPAVETPTDRIRAALLAGVPDAAYHVHPRPQSFRSAVADVELWLAQFESALGAETIERLRLEFVAALKRNIDELRANDRARTPGILRRVVHDQIAHEL